MKNLAIEMLSVNLLTVNGNSCRTHSKEQIVQVVRSIEEFGFTNPVLIDNDNGIIAGKCRVLAAIKAGMDRVPCIRLGNLNKDQLRAYIIADNRLALNAGWDTEILAMELAELKSAGFNIDLLGFDAGELADLLVLSGTMPGKTDPDDVPVTPADPISTFGDLWILGRHRLLCGDSTDKSAVDVLLNGARPELMVTDPPYGVEYDASWRNEAGLGQGGNACGKVLNDNRADWRAAWELFPGGVAYVWHAGTFAHVVADSLISCGFFLRSCLIWAKSSMVISRGHYHPQHEPCWYAVRKGATAKWRGGRKQKTLIRFIKNVTREDELVFVRWDETTETLFAVSGDESTVWEINKPIKSDTGHSTQKPVECMARPMRNHDIKEVYDPFCGSGSGLIAAEIEGRSCYAIELSPAYCDVIITRWQNFTGKEAINQTGKTFNAEVTGAPNHETNKE